MPSPHFSARPRARLGCELLEDRTTPAFLSGAELVVGSDAGGPPLVRLIDPTTGNVNSQFLAFDGSFYGGVRVAVGDVTGDAVADLVVAAGPGGGPQVNVYDGLSGGVVRTFFAYPSNFTGGVFVAVGDVNGDGRGDIITGAGAGGGPQVNAFDVPSGQTLAAFYAYSSDFLGGVRVAAGDLNGSGPDEIVTAPGYGGGPDVRAFAVNASSGTVVKVAGYYAMDPNFYGGLTVAVGNVTGDSLPEIVVGAGPTGGPRVDVFTAAGTRLTSFFAYPSNFDGGVRVGTADLTGDGIDEIVTGTGPTGGAQVNVYSLASNGTTPVTSLFALPAEQYTGIWVDGSTTPLNIASSSDSAIAASYANLRSVDQSGQAIYGNYYNYGGGFWGWGGYYGAGFYDAVGLYVGLDTFYGGDVYDPGYDAGNPFDYFDPGYIDPGYTDPSFSDYDYLPGYTDPGYDYYPGYSDPGYDYYGGYDYGGYDYGGYDYGGFDYGGFDFGGF